LLYRRLLPVSRVQFRQIAADIGLDLFHPALELGLGKVAVAAVDCLELAAVDCHNRVREQVQLLAQHDKLPAHIADRFAIIFAEIRDRLEVRRQAVRQPHQLDITLRFALEPTARLDAVEVAVNVELEKHGGMVSRPARLCWLHPREAQEAKVKFVHEYIDQPHWIVFGHVVVQEFGQQRALATILAFDKALHFEPVLMRYWLNVYRAASVYTTLRFYTVWVGTGPS